MQEQASQPMRALKDIILQPIKNSLNNIAMKVRKRYIAFYKIKYNHCIPYLDEYGMMCTRTWWSCFKMGLKYIKQGKATFFMIENNRPKKH